MKNDLAQEKNYMAPVPGQNRCGSDYYLTKLHENKLLRKFGKIDFKI
jgi:hypothetical protein